MIAENHHEVERICDERQGASVFWKYTYQCNHCSYDTKVQGEMMDKGFKPTYLKTINNQLSSILNYVVRFYELHSNPCHKAGSMGESKADERPYFRRNHG